MDRLLNKAEVCALLGISRATVDRIVASGELEALRIRGQVRFTEEDLRRYLARCREPRVRPAPAAAPAAQKEPARRGRPKGSRKETELVYFPGMKIV